MSEDPASKERLRLWLRILSAQRVIENEVRERLRVEHDTTLPRFDVMAALYRNEEGLKMSELSGELRVSNGNVTGIVDRLVNDGLIVRAPVPGDRRAMLVRLTDEGRNTFAGMAEAHEGWIDDLLGAANADEAAALAGRLHEITTELEGRSK
ncbi:MAG: MarR family transcriptional regulator [Paracoccaceae bacterium]|nr:MarR family transcriptional regulator [Paracoccaceae bacterium]MDG1371339.1 MarR family transcriptional regulator [Paracoccaceae bacterium]MDG1971267.1 MarR family transcriptional regulator [Paracoccaceae bacterium]